MPSSDRQSVAPTGLVAPYDEVTVVSQGYLNFLLRKMFKETPPLHEVSFKDPTADEDETADDLGCRLIFDAPKIVLQLGTESKVTTLVLTIKGGNLKYLKMAGRNVSPQSASIPTFTIALDVNLVAPEVPFTSLPENIQTSFASIKDLKINKTVFDLQAAGLHRLRKHLTTLYDVIKDVHQVTMITQYIESYLKLMAQHEDKFIFNYFATLPKALPTPGALFPLLSIAPTEETALQNLPTDNSTQETRTAEESLLSFLQMTEGGILPRDPLPTVEGKWASGIDPRVENPVVVISKAKFLETCIIKPLAEINRLTTWIIDSVWIDVQIGNVRYGARGHLGWEDADESDIAWLPLDSKDVPTDTRMKVKGPGSWFRFRDHKNKPASGAMGYSISQTGTTENYIFVPEGMPPSGKIEIAVFGRTLVESDFHSPIPGRSCSGWATTEWNGSVAFDSSKPEKPVEITINDVRARPDSQCHDEEFDSRVIQPSKEQLEQFKFSMQDLDVKLKAGLQANWPFFIPVRDGPYHIDRFFFGQGADVVFELKQRD